MPRDALCPASSQVQMWFMSTLSAFEFCMALQTELLTSKWPKDIERVYATKLSGPVLIWNGPRVAMSLHKRPDFDSNESLEVAWQTTAAEALELAHYARGGEVCKCLAQMWRRSGGHVSCRGG